MVSTFLALSIDLTLSNEFRYYKPGNKVVRVTEETNYEDITVKVEVPPGEGYLLLPGQLCLGITTEKIKLAPGICGLLGMYMSVSYSFVGSNGCVIGELTLKCVFGCRFLLRNRGTFALRSPGTVGAHHRWLHESRHQQPPSAGDLQRI